jgi:hypothetical protein
MVRMSFVASRICLAIAGVCVGQHVLLAQATRYVVTRPRTFSLSATYKF